MSLEQHGSSKPVNLFKIKSKEIKVFLSDGSYTTSVWEHNLIDDKFDLIETSTTEQLSQNGNFLLQTINFVLL